MSRQFNNDSLFSKHKDVLLKRYWSKLAFEGRYVIVNSEFIQKSLGIDVILQSANDITDKTIDTKHTRANYARLFLEEKSCTNKGRESDGWMLKSEAKPDYVMFFQWSLCQKGKIKCNLDCNSDCPFTSDQLLESCKGYVLNFKPLQEWFIEHKESYDPYTMPTENRTMGRNVPIKHLEGISVIKEVDLKSSLA
tara:strand:+ start:399 stop:980 length:582 start_codon:yes stop_codon:yes gene_type:complete